MPPDYLPPSLSASPNPFHDKVQITYQLKTASQVRLLLTDLNSKVLMDEEKGWQDIGEYNHNGHALFAELPSDIYFLRLETDQGSMTKKLVKMKD